MEKKNIIIPFPEFHPEVMNVSKTLYETGHFTQALRESSIRLEEICKEILKEKTGDEETGTILMAKLFCEKNGKVIFPMVNMSLQNASDKQKNFYFLFSGFAGAIRNELAHSTKKLDDIEALYGLNMVSYLFYKLDKAKEFLGNGEERSEVKRKNIQKIEKINVKGKNMNIKEVLIDILLNQENILNIKNETLDRDVAKLNLEKNIIKVLSDEIEDIGEDLYNYYFENKEEVHLIILQKLYDKN